MLDQNKLEKRKLSEAEMKQVSGGIAGTVKFYNASKGYGFITPASGGKDVLVRSTTLGGANLSEGDKVNYEVSAKNEATSVAVISSAPPPPTDGGYVK